MKDIFSILYNSGFYRQLLPLHILKNVRQKSFFTLLIFPSHINLFYVRLISRFYFVSLQDRKT